MHLRSVAAIAAILTTGCTEEKPRAMFSASSQADVMGGRLEEAFASAGYLFDAADPLKAPQCGVTLIAPDRAVTAAQCVVAAETVWRVAFGAKGAIQRDVAAAYIVPDYATVESDDLAVLLLADPINDVSPAVVHAPREECGYRAVAYDLLESDSLEPVDVERRSAALCVESVSDALVVSAEDGLLCYGDTGSGLFESETEIVGVTSNFATTGSGDCTADAPSLFTNLDRFSSYLDCLETVTASASPTPRWRDPCRLEGCAFPCGEFGFAPGECTDGWHCDGRCVHAGGCTTRLEPEVLEHRFDEMQWHGAVDGTFLKVESSFEMIVDFPRPGAYRLSAVAAVPQPGDTAQLKLAQGEQEHTFSVAAGRDSAERYTLLLDVPEAGRYVASVTNDAGPLLVRSMRAESCAPVIRRTVFELDASGSSTEGGVALAGTARMPLRLPSAGMYRFRVKAYGQPAAGEAPRLVLLANQVGEGGGESASFEVEATAMHPDVFSIDVPVSQAAVYDFTATFTNDFSDPEQGIDRNLVVAWLEVLGEGDCTLPAWSSCATAHFASDTLHLCGGLATWTEAQAFCQANGATLAYANDAAENTALQQSLSVLGDTTWLGLNDRQSEGQFVWAHGGEAAEAIWAESEPNNFGDGEDCGAMNTVDGEWNDVACTERFPFACREAPSCAGVVCDDDDPCTADACGAGEVCTHNRLSGCSDVVSHPDDVNHERPSGGGDKDQGCACSVGRSTLDLGVLLGALGFIVRRSRGRRSSTR